ncbi:uncharacterized protein LOC127811001 [Diospyros lotus]|uniref:uncharacterized protein LOC127811001 n=1 Tax=Diospyros lotus TaxID=55363 RepID=UPI00224FAE79|nr:uncharacterized protein LOC127811001 [Diospyros lotus]
MSVTDLEHMGQQYLGTRIKGSQRKMCLQLLVHGKQKVRVRSPSPLPPSASGPVASSLSPPSGSSFSPPSGSSHLSPSGSSHSPSASSHSPLASFRCSSSSASSTSPSASSTSLRDLVVVPSCRLLLHHPHRHQLRCTMLACIVVCI